MQIMLQRRYFLLGQACDFRNVFRWIAFLFHLPGIGKTCFRFPFLEWLDYLKNNRISETTTTPGLREARERLLYMTMTEDERRAYDAHLDNIMVQNDVLDTAKLEGREEGLKEGIIVGREKGKTEACLANARKMKQKGYPSEDIAEITGLSEEEIAEL